MAPLLFEPFQLAGLTLSNRIVVSPMCQYSADDGCANDWHFVHYGALANSGAALLVIEATAVEPLGRISHGCLGLYSAETEAALARVLAFCRSRGTAHLGIQLGHAGRKASCQRPWEGGAALPPEAGPWQTIAPSAVPFGPGWHVPTAMSEADMDGVAAAFVAAAERALRLGFDWLELHMAHGYLLHEFLSPLANRREDAYGGSFENRMRFPLRVAQAVREVWPSDRPLGVRLTGSDWLDGGVTPDEAVLHARAFKDAGIDIACLSSGAIMPRAPIPVGPNYQVPFAARVRREAGLPTRAVGLITRPEQAAAIVDSGEADLIAIGRGFLDDPRWAWHAANDFGVDLRRTAQYERTAPTFWPAAVTRKAS